MKFIIIILIIVIIILISYLFLLKNELNKIIRQINLIKKNNSNNLINSEISFRQLNKLINEINSLFTDYKKVKINYENKSKNLKKMMMNISHDLRTPLTSALGYIDIILNESSNKKNIKELETINARLKRLEELINSFFDLNKIISNNNEIILVNINLISLLQEAIIHYYDDFTKSNREIIFNSDINKYIVNSNREMLTRVFDNLISNAYKHGIGNLEIRIDFKNNLKIIFSNEFIYDDLDIDHIFDEFYIFDISRTKENTGLGLAIVKEFVNALNGKVAAQKNKKYLNIIIEF